MSDPILHQLCQDKLAFPLNLLPVTFQLKQIAQMKLVRSSDGTVCVSCRILLAFSVYPFLMHEKVRKLTMFVQ